MPNYRRAIVPGGTFFFTVVSWQRRAGGSGDGARSAPYISDLLLSENIGKGAIQDHGSQTETIGGHFQALHSNYWIFRRDCG